MQIWIWLLCLMRAATMLMRAVSLEQMVLMSSSLMASTLNWIPYLPAKEFSCNAKFRYRQPEQAVDVVVNDDGTATVYFHEKQRAVTPGQFVVFYDETKCLGGGIIETVTK